MAIANKWLSYLGIGYETTAGTAVPPTVLLPFRGNVAPAARRPLRDPQIVTGRLAPVDPLPEPQEVAGDLEVPVDTAAFRAWLQAIYGEPAEGGVYTRPVIPPAITVYRYHPDIGQYATYAGVHVAKWAITAGNGQGMLCRLSLVGRTVTWSGTAPTGTPTETPATGWYQRAQAAVGLAVVGGAAITSERPTELQLEADFQLAKDTWPLDGANYATVWLPGPTMVKGSLKALWQNLALLTPALGGTPLAVTLTLTNSLGALLFSVPRALLEPSDPQFEGANGVLQTLPFQASAPGAEDVLHSVTWTPAT